MKTIKIIFIASIVFIFTACNSTNNQKDTNNQADSSSVFQTDTAQTNADSFADSLKQQNQASIAPEKASQPVVLIYNFHVTNRCASCIAIEEATTKTLKTYFASELKQGRIKRQIINVDEKANQKISEKYEAFGSGLFVTRVFKGKETTADLTGDGFKFARNKEERFIELLKTQITEYLK